MHTKDTNPASISSASFRDPAGFVFKENGCIMRQINKSYSQEYEQLMTSGLYQALTKHNLLVSHKEIENPDFLSVDGLKVIQPEQINYISYPYEWCFSQLKDAALLTLEVQKRALQHNMSLKDASAYNVQFNGPRPIFIDTLSFEEFTEKPWVAYKQFCQHFLAPLALASHCDFRINHLLKSYIDGIPIDLAAKLLPGRTRLKLGLLMHIHMHAKSQSKFADRGREDVVQNKISASRLSKEKSIAIIDQLVSTIKGLSWQPDNTEWGNYYSDTNYQEDDHVTKAALLKKYIARTEADQPMIQDLGGNDGTFSREVANNASMVISLDIDEIAVEKNYLRAKTSQETNILPLIQNITNPSPAIGWANKERDVFGSRGDVEISLALALIHHIAISNGIPLKLVAQYFSKLSPYLIIEFVSKEDSQVKRLLATREDIFDDYTNQGFEKAFEGYFEIIQSDEIEQTERTMYLMKAKTQDALKNR